MYFLRISFPHVLIADVPGFERTVVPIKFANTSPIHQPGAPVPENSHCYPKQEGPLPPTLPETTIITATNALGISVNSHSVGDHQLPVTFYFDGTSNRGISGFECSINGAPFSTCTSPISSYLRT